MSEENLSLTQWCKDNDLSKTKVWKRCKEMLIDVSEGLSFEVVKILEKEFNIVEPQAPSPAPTVPHVDVGNSQMTIATPQIPSQFDLGGLRSGQVQAFENPLDVAQQFVAAAQGITAAMQQDIDQRRMQLEQTKAAKDAVTAQAEKLTLEARLYQLQTNQLDRDTTEETLKLQQRLAELQALGKPPSSEEPSSSP